MHPLLEDERWVKELPPLAGRFKATAVLGRGGAGLVLAADDTQTGEKCALKILDAMLVEDPEARVRFEREVAALANLESEHIVRVIQGGVLTELDRAPYYAMPRLLGTDVAVLVRTRGKQAPSRVADWMAQIASGLSHAHALGYVHRDLKPANVFLTVEPGRGIVVKILDFGAVKLLQDGSSLTATKASIGTPRYMAPEQVRGSRHVLPSADQWSFSLLAYELLTGEPYFGATSPTELLRQILSSELPLPSRRSEGVSPAMDPWFLRSWQRDPKARFATVREQMDALAPLLVG